MSMSKRILAFRLFLAVPLLLCPLLTRAQDHAPLQVDLIRAIDAGRVKVGDPVFAKVAMKWKSPGCSLAQGAVLQGRIVAQTPYSRANRTSEVALLFESAQC